MLSLSKIFNAVSRFGFVYLLCLILKKIGVLRELPVRCLLKQERYYRSLPEEKKKRELARNYREAVGRELHLENPATFTEKIQWLKFYDSTKRKADLSDKYLARLLIAREYGDRIKTIPVLGVWTRAEDIDFGSLPDKFVLKCNHGSSMNILVTDKSKLNQKKVRRQLNDWLMLDYAYVGGMYENHYTFIERRIVAEQFIGEADGSLHDYKFYCFNGEPRIIGFVGDRVASTHTIHSTMYTLDWKRLGIRINDETPYGRDFERPARLSDMVALARDMARDFAYVRVDLYYVDNEIYFGELTFTPDSGFIRFSPDGIDEEWGDMLRLPAATPHTVRKRVAWLPYNISENRFIRELRKAAEMAGAENVSDSVLWRDTGAVDYLVLNFYENISRRLGFFFTTYLGKLFRLVRFRIKGVKIVWVINNKLPHDGDRQWARRMMRWLIRMSYRVVILCTDSVNTVRKLDGNERRWKDKIVLLPHPNYINSYKASPAAPADSGFLRILFFGSIRPYKNIDILIAAFRELRNPRIHLTIAGCARAEEYRRYIESLAYGVDNIRLILNYIPDDEISSLVSAADMLVLPYDNETTLNSGVVILACSMRKTCITPRIGTVKDFSDSSLMYTYEYDTQLEHRDRLTEQILRAYNDFSADKNVLREKGEALYEIVKNRHSTEVLADIFRKDILGCE